MPLSPATGEDGRTVLHHIAVSPGKAPLAWVEGCVRAGYLIAASVDARFTGDESEIP